MTASPGSGSTPAGDPAAPCDPRGPGSQWAEPRGPQGPGRPRRPQEGLAAKPRPERGCPRLLLPSAWTPFTEQAATRCSLSWGQTGPYGGLCLRGRCDQLPVCTAGRRGLVRPLLLVEGLKLGGPREEKESSSQSLN